ncbi:hypothetical protein [Streptomyces sp. NPDC026589]|uniref:hypothetical protein n=1 Tax=Streptomyces sp. NPDC026589 TaxID=3155609 RepID=UPI0033E0FAF4
MVDAGYGIPRLASGIVIPLDTLVVASTFTACGGFLEDLGLTLSPHPAVPGVQVAVDPSGFTGVQGVWAAGNICDVLAGVPQPAGAGNTAGGAVNMDLILDGARRATDLGTRAHGLEGPASCAARRFRNTSSSPPPGPTS